MIERIATARLGDYTAHISSGSTPRGGETVYLNNGPVMLIRSQNVRMNHLDLADVAFITEEMNGAMQRSVVQPGDVLLNITGASIGRVAPFRLTGVRANVNQHVCIIRAKPDEFDGKYLSFFIISPRFQLEIDRLQRGGTRQALTFGQIAEFQIPKPSIAEQKRIAAILAKADGIRRKRREAHRLTVQLVPSIYNAMFGDPVTNPKWSVPQITSWLLRISGRRR